VKKKSQPTLLRRPHNKGRAAISRAQPASSANPQQALTPTGQPVKVPGSPFNLGGGSSESLNPQSKERLLKQIRRHLSYANVMSSIAVFLMLGGATAFAATKIGANEIKANSIKTGKIVKEAVTSGKLKNGAVTESKIADGAVTTNKIANDAVTGDKAKESTFGQVPSAANANNANTVGGVPASALTVGRSGYEISCFGTTDYTCATTTLSLPRSGRVLLVSQLPMHADADASSASCHLTRNGAEIPNTETTPGVLQDTDSNEGSETANGGVTVVTAVLPAGSSTFTQVCSDTGGNPHFRTTSISAVLLGTD